MTPILNSEADQRKIIHFVDRLSNTRIFRRMKVEHGLARDGQGWVSCKIEDGNTKIKTKPFRFHVATMEWPVLYGNVKALLVAAFSAYLDTMIAPELVLEGTLGVEVERADTDGEERFVS